MKISLTTLRQLIGGVALATGISLSLTTASAASMQCEATIQCSGQVSYTCECLASGICDSHDGRATCSCQTGTITCTCANGCDVLMD